MTHADLDAVIYPWAKKHGLFIYTKDRDCEVRAIDIVDDEGTIYKLGITPSGGENSTVGIDIWVSRDERASYRTSLQSLAECLDDAYGIVCGWMRARGHTRTPVL